MINNVAYSTPPKVHPMEVLEKLQSIQSRLKHASLFHKYLDVYFYNVNAFIRYSWAPTAVQYIAISSILCAKTYPLYTVAGCVTSAVSAYILHDTPRKLFRIYSKQERITKICIQVLNVLTLTSSIIPIACLSNFHNPIKYILPVFGFMYSSSYLVCLKLINHYTRTNELVPQKMQYTKEIKR